MSKFQHDVMLKIVKVIDLVMITIPFALCWELYYSYQVYAKFGWRGNWAMIGLFAVLFFLLGKVYDAFWMSLQRISELLYGQILAAMATDGILYIVICLMSRRLCNILPGIAAIAGQVVMATLWARCANSWYFRTYPPQPTAVVYDVRHGLEKLINEFFEITRYNLQGIVLEKETIDLYYMLVQMTDEFYPLLQAHQNTTELDVDEEMTIYGDAENLARVFNNILKNAVAYSYPGTAIKISAKQTDTEVQICFQNKGKTIPAHKLESIFEKFFRLDESRSSNTGGAGLGLAIAKEIVTLHGGTISADSHDEITTFSITLPVFS